MAVKLDDPILIADTLSFMRSIYTQLPQGKQGHIDLKADGVDVRILWKDRCGQKTIKILDGRYKLPTYVPSAQQ